MHVMELWVMATFYLVSGDESYGGTSHAATTQTLRAETHVKRKLTSVSNLNHTKRIAEI